MKDESKPKDITNTKVVSRYHHNRHQSPLHISFRVRSMEISGATINLLK